MTTRPATSTQIEVAALLAGNWSAGFGQRGSARGAG
jgi:hypothetical protein